jgi:iron complex transport system ATP-binding protein
MNQLPLLAVHAVTLAAGSRTLLRALSFAVHHGEFWCVLGANGAGKTTLLDALAGLHARHAGPRHAGTIALQGRPLSQWSAADAARVRGYLPQHTDALFGVTALQAALLGRHPHRDGRLWESTNDIERTLAALAQVDLADCAARDIGTLSGGERRRVAVAALLAQDPQLYLLDEPLAHLDLKHQIALMKLLRALASDAQRGVVATLHDATLAARFATHALVIGAGQWAAGPVAEVLTAPVLSRAFDHPVRRLAAGGQVAFVAE